MLLAHGGRGVVDTSQVKAYTDQMCPEEYSFRPTVRTPDSGVHSLRFQVIDCSYLDFNKVSDMCYNKACTVVGQASSLSTCISDFSVRVTDMHNARFGLSLRAQECPR